MQLVEVETLMAIFNGNPHLTNQISKSIVQYVIQCIEKGRHSKYLEFLQTIVRVNGSYNRRVQDMVMQEVRMYTRIYVRMLGIVSSSNCKDFLPFRSCLTPVGTFYCSTMSVPWGR